MIADGKIYLRLSLIRILAVLPIVGVATLSGCDSEGRKKCVWTLEPELTNLSTVDKGMIPLCARNRETMKQDCRLQSSLVYAKESFGKKFRYVDLKVKSYGIPRTVKSIEFCD